MADERDAARRAGEATRREEAARRDAERQRALDAGARAGSRAEGDGGGALAVARTGLLALAGLLLVGAAATWGGLVSALLLGGAVASAAAGVAAHRAAGTRRVGRAAEDARMTAFAGSVAGGGVDGAWGRARDALGRSDLPVPRRDAILSALDAARDELRAAEAAALRAGRLDTLAPRIEAFTARCRAIAEELDVAAAPAPSALERLGAVADELAAEAAADREIAAALASAAKARQG